MDNGSSMPLAYVISKDNLLKKYLEAELSHKQCRVTNKVDPSQVPQYLFLIQGIEGDFLSEAELAKVFEFVQIYKTKTEIILPYIVTPSTRAKIEYIANKARELENPNLTIIYVGEIFGVRMKLDKGVLPKIIGGIAPEYDFDLYIIDAKNCAGVLLKGIFSYGFGKKEVVVANKIAAFNLIDKIKKLTKTSFSQSNSITPPLTISNFDLVNVSFSEGELKKTIEWAPKIEIKQEVKMPELPEFKLPKLKIPEVSVSMPKVKFPKRKGNKKAIKIGFLLLWILSLPFLSFFMASLFLKLGFKSIKSFDLPTANLYLEVSRVGASFSGTTFLFFNDGRSMSKLIYDYSTIGTESVKLLSLGQKISNEMQGSEPYDLQGQSNNLYLGMDDIYKKVSYLIADKNQYRNFAFLPTDVDLVKFADFLNKGKNLVKHLPGILGSDKQKSYIVLVQDSNEIWPTGGRISSFGIFTFDGGRLSGKNFYETTSVDSLMKGQIDPPLALEKYLGLRNLKFSYSNWDSDFATSATRAEWFLKNELQQNTDGVVGVNQETFNNLKDFKGNVFQWGSMVLSGLQEKKVTLFLNNEEQENYLTDLSWDGGYQVASKGCASNCLYLPFGMVEANLGNNKIEGQINRNTNLMIDLSGRTVRNKLTIDFVNSSSETYKDYIRILVPRNVVLESGNLEITQVGDRTEAGIFVQIPAGGRKEVSFSWSFKNIVDFSFPGKLLIYIRKQPGIENPSKIQFTFPSSLTGKIPTSYNTSLKTDFVKEIDF